MGLELDRAPRRQRGLAVEVVLHPCVLDDPLAVEPDADDLAHHHDAQRVPLAERLVHAPQRILAGGAGGVVPQAAAAQPGLGVPRLVRIPDLDLRAPAEVHAAVGPGHGAVLEAQFKIAVEPAGAQIEALAVVDQLAALGLPVLPDVGQALVHQGLEVAGGHRQQFARILGAPAEPPLQARAVEQRLESRLGAARVERRQNAKHQ